MSVCLVLTNLPDADTAEKTARWLIEARLAACVNVLAPCHSVYRWAGQVETCHEVPLLIKTTEECYPLLETALRERHPYEVPEIVMLPLERGLPAYLRWVEQEANADLTGGQSCLVC